MLNVTTASPTTGCHTDFKVVANLSASGKGNLLHIFSQHLSFKSFKCPWPCFIHLVLRCSPQPKIERIQIRAVRSPFNVTF